MLFEQGPLIPGNHSIERWLIEECLALTLKTHRLDKKEWLVLLQFLSITEESLSIQFLLKLLFHLLQMYHIESCIPGHKESIYRSPIASDQCYA